VALNFLAENCPKLLTISCVKFMIAKRANQSESFRFVKSQSQIKGLDKFDEDSLDSCSDDDCGRKGVFLV
jgi:hypothetical protein